MPATDRLAYGLRGDFPLGSDPAPGEEPVCRTADQQADEDAEVRAKLSTEPARQRAYVRRVGVQPKRRGHHADHLGGQRSPVEAAVPVVQAALEVEQGLRVVAVLAQAHHGPSHKTMNSRKS